MRRFRFLLNDQVDAGVVAAESIGGNASEQGRVFTFSPLDADGGEHAILLVLLTYGISWIHVRVQPLVVHVPNDANRFLALGLALQDRVVRDESCLGSFLNLKGRWS